MKALQWKCRDRVLDLREPLIMGIVNVTPDSFSDGGTHVGLEAALDWGRKLADEGAHILDVGGESTRPGAADVSVQEELARVVPVVRSLVAEGYTVSVDTSKSEVMRACLDAGVHILNDVRSFTEPGALQVAANSDAGLVIMHMQGAPRTMQASPHYEDVVAEVLAWLKERDADLTAAGVSPDRICWDPGFGFGKSTEHNFALLRETALFADQGRAYLMGLSRKSSLGAVTGQKDASKRIVSSVAGALFAVDRGAQIVRVHDVRETQEALAVWRAAQAA
ncbi:MAG: dihydropteroate synthase [Duodenibacillus sp.]|nr:dihydropteroate synthase [Duodenibacillus sp.]